MLTANDGLVYDNVWDLRFDAKGRLWIATRGGLSMYDNGTWANFQRSSGLNNPKLWPLLPEPDRVFIGTDGNGVDILSLDEMSNPPPRVIIEKPIVDGANVSFSWHAYAYWGEITEKEIPTRYNVDDNPWSPWSIRRTLTLTDLDVGEHRVRVQAKGFFGKYDSSGGLASISIVPPLYFRTAFILPIGILVMLLMYLGALSVIRKRQHLRSLVAYQEQLRNLASELSLTEERERKRVASYLHDTIAQALIFCKIKIGSLAGTSPSTDVKEELSEVEKMLEESIESTRQLTLEMSPPVLSELSFGDALEWLAERIQNQHGLEVKFSDDEHPKPLGEDIRSVLFLAVREALTNVVKHARAKTAAIALRSLGETIQISIQDDGIGFAPDTISGNSADGSRFGLFNIRERLRPFGGRLDIDSAPGKGTCLTLTQPLLSNNAAGQ
jgi:signal transduction histidine kinase